MDIDSPGKANIDLDKEREANRQLRTKEYFYSERLGQYVGVKPMRIDDRVVKAAAEQGIDLSWDDEGRIKDINLVEIKKLAKALGSSLLSTREYWQLWEEAQLRGDEEMLLELQSPETTEWLDVVYIRDDAGNVSMIEHPEYFEDENGGHFSGKKVPIDMPEGRPGWFDPHNNIVPDTGLPQVVKTEREKGTPGWKSPYWKYWSSFKTNEAVAPIRGFVVSCGTPSIDCDIPIHAKQPVLMFRECRTQLQESPVSPELLAKAEELHGLYLQTIAEEPAEQNSKALEDFYNQKEAILDFIETKGGEFFDGEAKEAVVVREHFIDALGLIRILANDKNDRETIERLEGLTRKIYKIDRDGANLANLNSFIGSSRTRLAEALETKKKIIFVMGHKNPDSDTAISSIAEAFRNQLCDQSAEYIPVIQSHRVPDEIAHLVGKTISEGLLLDTEDDYQKALKSGQARWILVDQNVSDVQRFAISIVDHHVMAEKTKRQDVVKSWEMAGSTAALVAQKYAGMGLEMDQGFAKILYGATLMDTENRSDRKMTCKDRILMDQLQDNAGVISDDDLFQELMSHLLNTEDAEALFSRDYKQDWGIFGYAVAKTRGVFSPEGEVLKPDLLLSLEAKGIANNHHKNFPLTIVKVADYLDDNETVNRERVYTIFNHHVLPEFKATLKDFIKAVIDHEYKGRAQIEIGDNYVEFWGVGDQLSRKVTAPFIEPIVTAFNEYCYSAETKYYVKREFLKRTPEVEAAAKELGFELFSDKDGRINNITFSEAKLLLEKLGLSMMSLPEYWKILNEAERVNDEQLCRHLKSPGFVELLDTVILDSKKVIDHPTISNVGDKITFDGEVKEVEIIEGVPGLVYPEDIDPATGFPKIVHNPRKYGDPRFWRYWSPDAPVCLATRGHIFLLNQPSFDTKIHPEDALPNLGVRPCCREVKPPKVKIIEEANGVRVEVER